MYVSEYSMFSVLTVAVLETKMITLFQVLWKFLNALTLMVDWREGRVACKMWSNIDRRFVKQAK